MMSLAVLAVAFPGLAASAGDRPESTSAQNDFTENVRFYVEAFRLAMDPAG